MKKLSLAILGILFGANSFAMQPTIYNCNGENGLTFNYSVTSFVGQPEIQATIGGKSYSIMGRDKVRVEESVIGDIVSFTDVRLAMVDGPTLHYALIVPAVHMGNMGQVTVKTHVITSTVASPFMRPDITTQIQTNKVLPVTCVGIPAVF